MSILDLYFQLPVSVRIPLTVGPILMMIGGIMTLGGLVDTILFIGLRIK